MFKFLLIGCSISFLLGNTYGIRNGYLTLIEDYPWQVMIETLDGSAFLCSGILIAANLVLTTSYECITPGLAANTVNIRAGSSILHEGGEVIAGAAKEVNPLFNETVFQTYMYDAVILRTVNPFTVTSTIQLATLASSNDELALGREGVVVGWGYTSNEGSESSQLMRAYLETQEPSHCFLQDGLICAGDPEGLAGVCYKDQGGSFVVSGVVHGIAHANSPCNSKTVPDNFVNIAVIRDWIEDVKRRI